MEAMTTKVDFADDRYTLDDLREMRTDIEEELLRRKERMVTPRIRREHGPHWTRLKMRECKGCGKVYSGQEMRTHPCSIAWPDR